LDGEGLPHPPVKWFLPAATRRGGIEARVITLKLLPGGIWKFITK